MPKQKKTRNIMKIRKISLAFLFISFPINLLNIIFGNTFLLILGILLLSMFFIMTFIFWRCPRCKKRLPLRFDKVSDINDWYRCPYCNTQFMNDDIID